MTSTGHVILETVTSVILLLVSDVVFIAVGVELMAEALTNTDRRVRPRLYPPLRPCAISPLQWPKTLLPYALSRRQPALKSGTFFASPNSTFPIHSSVNGNGLFDVDLTGVGSFNLFSSLGISLVAKFHG